MALSTRAGSLAPSVFAAIVRETESAFSLSAFSLAASRSPTLKATLTLGALDSPILAGALATRVDLPRSPVRMYFALPIATAPKTTTPTRAIPFAAHRRAGFGGGSGACGLRRFLLALGAPPTEPANRNGDRGVLSPVRRFTDSPIRSTSPSTV